MASRLLTSGLNHARPLPAALTFRWTTRNVGTMIGDADALVAALTELRALMEHVAAPSSKDGRRHDQSICKRRNGGNCASAKWHKRRTCAGEAAHAQHVSATHRRPTGPFRVG